MNTKQTIVIFEGHDMVGKTTILNALSEKLNIPSIKIEKKRGWSDPLIELMYTDETLCQLAEQSGYSFIFDRSFVSEYAYSRALSRVTSHEQIIKLDERFAAMNATIIVCFKDASAFQEDDKAIIDTAYYNSITEWYKEFAKFSKCKILFLNTTSENLEEQLEEIENKINEDSNSIKE